jgi:hypothetical protein
MDVVVDAKIRIAGCSEVVKVSKIVIQKVHSRAQINLPSISLFWR